MPETVKKSPLRYLRYAAHLLGQDARGFLRRLTSRLLKFLGIYRLIYWLDYQRLRILAPFYPALKRDLVRQFPRWMAALCSMADGRAIEAWLSDRSRPHILVIGMGSIGDALQITPVLRELKNKLPSASIAVLHRSASAKVVLKNNPYLDLVATGDFSDFENIKQAMVEEGGVDLIVEIRSMSFMLTYTRAPEHLRHPIFDAAFTDNFFKSAEAARWNWDAPHPCRKPNGSYAWPEKWHKITYLDVLGMMGNLPIDARSKLDFIPSEPAAAIVETLQLLQEKKIVTVQTGVDADVLGWAAATEQRPTKLMPPETWNGIVSQLKGKGFTVVQLGGRDDVLIDGVNIDLRGKTSLSEAALILKYAAFHLGTEGGLVHLARAMETKSIVLFGPTSLAFLGYPQNINLTAGDCHGCWGATKDWFIFCPRGWKEPECMQGFEVENVILEAAKGTN